MKRQKRVKSISYSDERIVIPPYRLNRWGGLLGGIGAVVMTAVLVSYLKEDITPDWLRLLSSGLALLSSLLMCWVFLDNCATVTIDAEGVSKKGPVSRKHLAWTEIRTFDTVLPLGVDTKAPKYLTLCFAVPAQAPDRLRTKGPSILVPMEQEEYRQFEAEGRPRCERWRA